MSTKPHQTGCHVWKDVCNATQQEVNELSPDVIVECSLDAKYYHYNPVQLNDLSNANDTFKTLANYDEVLTVNQATTDDVNACTSIDDNFKELRNACPSCEADTVNPKCLEHQSGNGDRTCPICIEE